MIFQLVGIWMKLFKWQARNVEYYQLVAFSYPWNIGIFVQLF